MAIIGTYNGASIVQTPASPVPKSVQFKAQEIVAVSASPFTGQTQIQDWQAGWLEASVTLPPMTLPQAQAWVAWLLQLRGQANVFLFGFSDGRYTQGSAGAAAGGLLASLPDPNGDPGAIGPIPSGATGSAVVADSGATAQTGFRLATRGWPANQPSLLLPGDWLQVGYRLYRTLDAVSSDGNGKATLDIWPPLREPVPDATPEVFNEGLIYGFQFDMREAI